MFHTKRLSKSAKFVLHALYYQYCSRRKFGIHKSDAVLFGSSESIHDDFCQNLSVEDITDALRELSSIGYFLIDEGDNSVACCEMTSSCIADLENANLDSVVSVADFISKFIP